MNRCLFIAAIAAGCLNAFVSNSYSEELHPVPSQNVDWSGFHAGVRVGAGFNENHLEYTYTDVPAFVVDLLPTSADLNAKGALLAAALGSDWQFGTMVLGIEADASWSGIRGTASTAFAGDVGMGVPPLDFTTEYELQWFATARARAGVAVDRILFYGTGGLALANVSLDTSVDIAIPGVEGLAGSETVTKVGWTAGGGVQFAITDHVDIGGEVLFYDLGSASVSASNATDPSQNHAEQAISGVIGRIGINRRF